MEVPSRTADTRRWRFCAGRHGTDDVVLLVAIFTVHLPYGFSSIKLMSYDAAGAHFGQPGYETDLLYIACLLALCIGGAGPLSLDSYLKGQRHV
jgi:putative oxidoreductase